MAKISFNKVNKIKSLPPVIYKYNDEVDIEIKQYLPVADKLELIIKTINFAGQEEEGFYNIVKLKVYYRLAVLEAYTNLSFTEKMWDEVEKTYDAIILNNLWDQISTNIPEQELNELWENICEMAKQTTEYYHSALGILKIVANDYSLANLDVDSLMNKLSSNADQFDLVKQMAQLT